MFHLAKTQPAARAPTAPGTVAPMPGGGPDATSGSSSARIHAALKSASKAERERAWRVLYQDNFDRIYRLVYRFGVRPGEVEDVVQQVFTIAYRKIGTQTDLYNPGNWLYGIAIRVVRDHHRWRRVRQLKQSLLEATADAAQGESQSPEASAAAAQAQRQVAEVLTRMSPKLREVLVLTDIEECELGEVAEILGIPKNTVRSRRQRARESFQKLWQARQLEEEPNGPDAP